MNPSDETGARSIFDQQLFYCDDARLDLMIEIEAEVAEPVQGILLACGDRAYRFVSANRLSLSKSAI